MLHQPTRQTVLPLYVRTTAEVVVEDVSQRTEQGPPWLEGFAVLRSESLDQQSSLGPNTVEKLELEADPILRVEWPIQDVPAGLLLVGPVAQSYGCNHKKQPL